MSVLIKDMEKPKSCYAVIDGEFEYCPFVNTDDDCVLQLKKGICEGTWEEQYSKCPLVETPEPCEDAVSRAEAIKCITYDEEYMEECLRQLPSVTPKQSNYKTDHGFMWICPDCGLMVHSDFEKCVRCGHKREE